MKKTFESPSTYHQNWLTIGLYGDQPGLGDFYNNQGSPYLCSTIFLPLGLSETDSFWTSKEEEWSSKRIWSGQDWKKDQSKVIQ